MKIVMKIAATFSTGLFAMGMLAVQPAQAGSGLKGISLAAKKPCGGEGQNSCWSANPTKWCKPGLKYIPGGIGRRGKCIKPPASRPVSGGGSGDDTPNCGGIGQRSCWSLKASKWCDPGLLYKPGLLPGKGRCEAPEAGNMVQYTRSVISRYQGLPRNNELSKLRKCVNNPVRQARIISAMKKQATNDTNSILRECNIDPAKLQAVANAVLGEPGHGTRYVRARGYGNDANPPDVTPGEETESVAKKFRLFLEFSAGAAAGSKDVGIAYGYAIPLHAKPKGPRWYKNSTNYVKGLDIGFGGDITVGLGFPGVPSGDGFVEEGTSGLVNIAALAKIGMLTRITDDQDAAFALMGGVGLGLTAATYEYANNFYDDK